MQNPSAKRLKDQVAALATRTPDIVALQEVIMRSAPLFHSHFLQLGLTHTTDSFALAADATVLTGPRQYGELIASCWPLHPLSPADFSIPWPERVLSTLIDSPWGTIELHTTHLPNGANHGWIKVETFEGIYARLACAAEHPRILCGDLNTPQQERSDGEVVTWGQDLMPNGEVVLEGTWRDPSGREDTSIRWDKAERDVLTGLASYGLPDVYQAIHKYTKQEFSWYWTGQGRQIGAGPAPSPRALHQRRLRAIIDPIGPAHRRNHQN